MSSAYHPQSDGQTERVNQCLETYLRCFVHTCPSKWIKWLSLAEYWYNTSFHSSLGSSPFEVLYGHQPNHFGLSSADVSVPADVSSWLKERSLMQAVARQHLLRAQQRMKKQADKSRFERNSLWATSFISSSNHTFNPHCPTVHLRSCPSSSSDHLPSQTASVLLLTDWRCHLHHLCTRSSTFHN